MTWVPRPPRRALRRSGRAVAHRQPRAGRAVRRGGVHQRDAPVAVLRRVGGFRRAPGLRGGDDIRRVDWRLYARTDRFYIKEYEADTNANFSVLLDVSKSMGFGSRGVTKLDYGKMLAGCLTYLVHKQRDRVGLVAFDSDIVEHVPPSAKHMDVVLHTLDRLKPSGPGSLRAPLHKMAEHFGRRGLLVLISDLYEDPDAVLEAVAPLRFRGNDIIVFHLLDPAELDFTFDAPSSFEDLESGGDSRRAGSAGRAVPRARARPHRRPDGAVLRQPHRLHAREHVGAARSRAVQLPDDARAADAGSVCSLKGWLGLRLIRYEFSDTSVPARARGRRRAGDHSSDPARAEERRAVSVADVPAADSLPVRPAAPDSQLAAAAAAARGARAHRRGVRAAVPAAAGAGGCGGGRRARSRRADRHLLQHGVWRSMGSRDGGGARRDRRAQPGRTARRSCSSRRVPRWRCDRRPTAAA